MDLSQVIAELRAELACLEEAIAGPERVAASRRSRRGRLPNRTIGYESVGMSAAAEGAPAPGIALIKAAKGPATSE
ncbi:MAG TPA: hypothetical protein VLY04_10510 [Bryobacteraceae bacterium]|nr:hypothetical protein [Bryobacteraceae bacterium]